VNAQILVVEDEPISQKILVKLLEQNGYQVTAADTGQQAWQYLSAEPPRFEAVLLDRNLPDIDGMDLLARIQGDAELKKIPVIMQTAMTEPEDIQHGLKSGAYYYVTKPFEQVPLLAIIEAAVRHLHNQRLLVNEVKRTTSLLTHLQSAEFSFRTPQQARDLATLLSTACPNGDKVVLGLSELMMNAVEHGNLNIRYRDKTELLNNGTLMEEIERRLSHPLYAEKTASIYYQRLGHAAQFRIRDQGAGFNWRDYLEISPDRAFDTHGRGIAMAKIFSFNQLEYLGCGNEVIATAEY
jgi:DNA-binding response OmpR family regulator